MTTTTPRPDPLPGARPAAHDDRATLRLGHPRELLALVPHLLGFQPGDSAVLVGLRPPGRQVGLVARVDLPDVLRPDGPELAAALADHLRDDGTAEVVVVLYAGEGDPRDPERGLRARPGSRGARAAEVLRRGLAGVGPLTTWSVDGGSYLGLDCRDRGCCPAGGRPLADLSGGDLAGRLVSRRGGVAGSREELGLVRPAPPGRRRSAAAARSRWFDALLRADGADAVLRWRQRSLAAWRGVLAAAGEPDEVPPAALGRVEAALLDPVVRDAVVLTLVAPEDAALPDAVVRTGAIGRAGAGTAWADDGGRPARASGPGERDAVASAECAECEADEERGACEVRRACGAGEDRGACGACDACEDREACDACEACGAGEDGGACEACAAGEDGGACLACWACGACAGREDREEDAEDAEDEERGACGARGACRARADREACEGNGACEGDGACEECADRGRRRPERDAGAGDPADAADRAPGVQDARTVSARVREALDRLVDPARGREPRQDVADAGRAALERVVAHGRRDRQAPALTVLALLAWWDGDAVRASVLVERALDQDPGHRLAGLLDRALGAGLPPGWVRRRC